MGPQQIIDERRENGAEKELGGPRKGRGNHTELFEILYFLCLGKHSAGNFALPTAVESGALSGYGPQSCGHAVSVDARAGTQRPTPHSQKLPPALTSSLLPPPRTRTLGARTSSALSCSGGALPGL